MHEFQSPQFLRDFFIDLFGQIAFFNFLCEFINVGFELIAFSKFLLDGLDLFIQIKFFLTAFHLFTDTPMNPFFNFKDFHFRFQDAEQFIQPVARIKSFQKVLLVGGLKNHVCGDGIGVTMRLNDICCSGNRFERNFLVQLDVLFKYIANTSHEGFQLGRDLLIFLHALNFNLIEIGVAVKVDDASALQAFDQHFHGAIGQFQDLQNIGDGARFKNIFWRWIVVIRVALCGKKNIFLLGHGFFQSADRLVASNEKRNHHERKNNNIP